MTQPCGQGERLATLEAILEQMSETLSEQKQLSVKTYEVLAVISGQSEQIKSLTTLTGELKRDVEIAFKSIRRIDLRHSEEDGAEKVEEKHEERQQKFWDGVKQQFTSRALVTLCFLVWLNDKYGFDHKVMALIKSWKEFKG